MRNRETITAQTKVFFFLNIHFHLLKHLSVDKTANYIKMKLPKYPCTDGQSLIMRL